MAVCGVGYEYGGKHGDDGFPLNEPALTARLLAHLETVLFEIGRMDATVDDTNALDPGDRRALKLALSELWISGDKLMAWLGEARLEAPKTKSVAGHDTCLATRASLSERDQHGHVIDGEL